MYPPTKDTTNYLQKFQNDHSGDAYIASGNFWRMLYLSATTATTLGMGDILPVSLLARLLVTCEAVAGLVCAGCFLNALANRIKGDQNDDS